MRRPSTPRVRQIEGTAFAAPEVFTLRDALAYISKSMKSMKHLPFHSEKYSPDHYGITINGISSASSSRRTSMIDNVQKDAELKINIETPPLICFGVQSESSGALLSGFLFLNVNKDSVKLQKLNLYFQSTVTTKKPVVGSCPGCSTYTSNLQEWTFVEDSENVVANYGEHSYPFSYHFPGYLPGTTDSILASIKYQLLAVATTDSGEEIRIVKDIKVQRAILPTEEDRQSIRIFPPTELSARVTLPPVVHVGGEFGVSMKLEGIKNKDKDTRWKIRKMAWKIEEVNKVVSPACKAHGHKVGGEGKGVQYDENRIIAGGEVKNGWKTDFDCEKGKVEAEFRAGIPVYMKTPNDVTCTAGNISVSHSLIIEMIVCEEHVPIPSKNLSSNPTGAARVLRMQFNLPVSDRGGMGISWVDECPPLYTDLPASPPIYDISNDKEDE